MHKKEGVGRLGGGQCSYVLANVLHDAAEHDHVAVVVAAVHVYQRYEAQDEALQFQPPVNDGRGRGRIGRRTG